MRERLRVFWAFHSEDVKYISLFLAVVVARICLIKYGPELIAAIFISIGSMALPIMFIMTGLERRRERKKSLEPKPNLDKAAETPRAKNEITMDSIL